MLQPKKGLTEAARLDVEPPILVGPEDGLASWPVNHPFGLAAAAPTEPLS